MKTEFKREMNRNYMVLRPENEIGGSYALRMLSENRITGLLPFQEKRIDGETFLYFNITSRQSLSRMMEYRSFKAKEIRQITSDLIVTMTALERFLMDGDQLCLEPDMIYVDPDDLRANFCLFPGHGSQFEESFQKLARYILDHGPHRWRSGGFGICPVPGRGEGKSGSPGSGKMSDGRRKGWERREPQRQYWKGSII